MTTQEPSNYPPEILELPDPDAAGQIPATPAPEEQA